MTDRTARNIVIVAVAAMIAMAVMLSDVWGANYKPPARWGEGIDSAKWFITLADGTHYDSTAGVARTNIASYDTTFTGLSNDTGYILNLSMWDGSDSASSWIFYWPVLRWDTRIDSIETALTDANVGDKVWTDPGTRTITGTGADAITATSIAANAITASEAPNLDAAITSRSSHNAGDVWEAGTKVITGGVLTTPGDYKADVSALALQAELDGLIMFFGACDECYQILYPRSGTANKDSVVVIDPSLGNDSLVGKIVFYHGTTPSVYDSSYFYIDEPW